MLVEESVDGLGGGVGFLFYSWTTASLFYSWTTASRTWEHFRFWPAELEWLDRDLDVWSER